MFILCSHDASDCFSTHPQSVAEQSWPRCHGGRHLVEDEFFRVESVHAEVAQTFELKFIAGPGQAKEGSIRQEVKTSRELGFK